MDEWLKYLENQEDGDPYEFAGFWINLNSDQDWETAFSKVRRGGQIADRIRTVISENQRAGPYIVPKPENRLDEAALRPLAEEYARSVVAFLVDIGETAFVEEITNNPLVIYTSTEFDQIEGAEKRKLRSSEALDFVGSELDHLPNQIGGDGMWEILYSVTASPEVAWYMADPGNPAAPLRSDLGYQLWKADAQIYFSQTETFLIVDDSD